MEEKKPKPTIEEMAQRVQRLEQEQQADAEALEAAERRKTAADSEPVPPEPTPPSSVPAPEPVEASAPASTVPEHEIERNKIAEIEINNFIKDFNLESLLPPEFEGLNETQKLKVVRDLKRRIVDIVKSDAQTQYSEDLKTKTAASISPSAFREFADKTNKNGKTLKGFLKFGADAVIAGAKGTRNISKTVGTAIKTSATKERDLKNIEEKVFGELRETEEGRRLIAQDLMRLTEMVKDKDVILDYYGNPAIRYIDGSNFNLFRSTEEERDTFNDFNGEAYWFTQMPYEWGQEKSGRHKKEYEKAKAEYEKAREKVLKIKETHVGPERALTEMLEIDNAIQMEQLLNTHPEFEKALDDFGRSAGGKELTKRTLKSFFTSNSASKANIGIGITGAGVRFGAKVGLGFTTFAASGMFVAAPVIGAVAGYWRGKIRGKKTLEERKKGARHGQEDESKEATNTVNAENLNKRMETIISAFYTDFGKMSSITVDSVKILGENERLDQLKRRIEYTQNKIENGLVNFGDAKTALTNQFNLINNLNRALVLSASLEETTRKDIDERLEKFLSYRADKISEAQDAFIKKQALRGAAFGAGFATAGYALRYVWEHVHFGGGHGIGWGNPADNLEEIDLQLHKNQEQIEELQKQLEELKQQMNGGKSFLTPNPKTPNPFAAYAAETPAQKMQRIEAAIEKLKADNAKLEALKNTTGAKSATSHTPSGENKFIHKPNGNVEEKLPNGTTKIYDKNWKILEERGLNNSFKKEYYPGGERLRYEKLPDGSERTYWVDGKLASEKFSNGSERTYSSDGKLFSETFFDKSKIIYYSDGTTEKYGPDGKEIKLASEPDTSSKTPEAKPATPEPATTAPTQPPASPSPETPVAAPETPKNPVDVKVELSSKGYTQTIIELKAKLTQQYASAPEKMPLGVKHFIETPSTKLAQDYGFWDTKAGTSGMGYEGETLSVDSDGNLKLGHLSGKIETIDTEDHKFSGKMFTPEKLTPKIPNTTPESGFANPEEHSVIDEYNEQLTSQPTTAEEIRAGLLERMERSGPLDEFGEPINQSPKPPGWSDEYGTPKGPSLQPEEGNWRHFGETQPSETPIQEKHIFSSSNSKEYKGNDKFFRDLSPMEERTLRQYPEFAKNPFHLTRDKLIEAYNTHQRNLGHIFQHNTDISGAWKEWRGLKASTILEKKNFDENNPLITYLHRIQEVTKLKPQGGFLTHKETVNEYIARALQKAASIPGGLQRVAESIRK